MARTSLLTPEKATLVFEALKAGKNVRQVCAAASISRTTYYNWLDAGERGEELYAEFRITVFEAQAIGDRTRHAALLASFGLTPATC